MLQACSRRTEDFYWPGEYSYVRPVQAKRGMQLALAAGYRHRLVRCRAVIQVIHRGSAAPLVDLGNYVSVPAIITNSGRTVSAKLPSAPSSRSPGSFSKSFAHPEIVAISGRAGSLAVHKWHHRPCQSQARHPPFNRAAQSVVLPANPPSRRPSPRRPSNCPPTALPPAARPP